MCLLFVLIIIVIVIDYKLSVRCKEMYQKRIMSVFSLLINGYRLIRS